MYECWLCGADLPDNTDILCAACSFEMVESALRLEDDREDIYRTGGL